MNNSNNNNPNNNPNNFSSVSNYSTASNSNFQTNTAPWSQTITRNLCDKLYERRKQGAQEVQLFIRELCSNGFEKEKISYIVDFVLEHLLYNSNPNYRKGGLISLSAVALALGSDVLQVQRKVLSPVINTLIDQDSRVRYYACESLLNILKISRHRSLPFFNDIFDNLCKLSADPEEQVRSAAQLVDRLLKDVVCESDFFDLEKFIPLLRERILINNPYVRQYILGWISVLNTVKHINMKDYFSEFLDGVFIMLGDNNKDIQRSADNTLGEFLSQIISFQNNKLINYSVIFKIIVPYCSSKDETTRLIALTWISELIKAGNELVLPYIHSMIGGILPLISNEETTIRELSIKSNSLLLRLIEISNQDYPMELLIQTVVYHLRSDFVNTRLAALRWIVSIFKKSKEKFLGFLDDLFPPTLKLLSDFADPVATMALEVLCTIAYNEIFFTKLMENLLRLFKSDQNLFEKRGALTFRQLSLYIDPALVIKTTAEIIKREKEEFKSEFTNTLAEMINMVFLTSLEFQDIRKKLTNNLNNLEIRNLFNILFEFFSHSPIATFTLCLIAQCYKLACFLIEIIADFDISVNFLIEIDKLIQLIESPLFTSMRFQLLEPEEHPYLFKCLYGLLMIIPQSSSFHILSNRLNSIAPLALLEILPRPDLNAKTIEDNSEIDFEKLLSYFKEVQESHFQYRNNLQRSNNETYKSMSQYEDYVDPPVNQMSVP